MGLNRSPPGAPKLKRGILPTVAVVLGGALLLQIAGALWRRNSAPAPTAFSAGRLEGKPASLAVRAYNATSVTTLSEGTAGECAYLFVYREGCAPCRNSFAKMLATVGESEPLVPEGWTFGFLMLDSVPPSHPIPAMRHRWKIWWVDGWIEGAVRFGLSATPAHLIVDRGGVITKAGIGVNSWRVEAFRQDCTIEQAPATNPPLSLGGVGGIGQ